MKREEEGPRVVIAPGHNMVAPGAQYYGLVEFHEALKVVWHLNQMLLDAGTDVHVVNGRITEKIREANHVMPAAAVEMHFNASESRRARGTEVLYGENPKSKVLAGMIQRRLVGSLGLPDRGIKPGLNWNTPESDDLCAWVTEVDAPAVIVEPLFLSSEDEALLLRSGLIHHEIAEAVARGMTEFLEADGLNERANTGFAPTYPNDQI